MSVSDDGPSSEGMPISGSPSYQAWRDIRERSVVDFVNTVARSFDAFMNRTLRKELYDVAFSNGLSVVRWNGVNYTGPLLLDLYRRTQQERR